jgi:hypothetical protein
MTAAIERRSKPMALKIESLTIDNFRAFRKIRIEGLG